MPTKTTKTATLSSSRRRTRMSKYEHSVNSLMGPAPINPYKSLREEYNYTLDSLSSLCSIHKQSIIRTEQGTYVEAPERIAKFWTESNHAEDYLALRDNYRNYQRKVRMRNHRVFGDITVELRQSLYAKPIHPFRILRSCWTDPVTNDTYGGMMNVTECAKLLCIPQGTLDYFENKLIHQTKVPQVMIDALRENGYSSHELQMFIETYVMYRAKQLGKETHELKGPNAFTTPVGSDH